MVVSVFICFIDRFLHVCAHLVFSLLWALFHKSKKVLFVQLPSILINKMITPLGRRKYVPVGRTPTAGCVFHFLRCSLSSLPEVSLKGHKHQTLLRGPRKACRCDPGTSSAFSSLFIPSILLPVMGGDSWLTDTNRPVRPPQGVHLPFKATQRRACMAAGQSPCSLHQGRCGDFLHKGGGDAAVVGCVCVCVRCPGNRVEVTGRRTRNVFTSQRIHDRQKRGQSSAPLLPPPLQGSRALTHLRDSRAMDRNDSRAWLSGEQLIYAITVPLSTAIILANLVIILGIAWNRQLHNTPNYLFLSLLVADLCTAVALPFIPLMGLNRELSSGSCLVAHFFPNFLFLAFLFNLVMVHYERYTCIVDPLRYSDLWMHRSFPLALLAVWAPPLLYASLPAFGWNNWTGADRDGQNATAPSSCSYRRVFPNAFIYLEVYGLVLPAILAIAGMTGRVLWITRGQLKDICRLHRSLERGGQASEREHRLNLRYVRCVVAVTMTFLACWVPQLIYMHVCIAFLVSDTRWSSTTHIVLSCTGVGSVAVVPLVLGLANRQYTEPAYTLLQKLRDRWCKGRRRRGGQSEEIVGNV